MSPVFGRSQEKEVRRKESEYRRKEEGSNRPGGPTLTSRERKRAGSSRCRSVFAPGQETGAYLPAGRSEYRRKDQEGSNRPGGSALGLDQFEQPVYDGLDIERLFYEVVRAGGLEGLDLRRIDHSRDNNNLDL